MSGWSCVPCRTCGGDQTQGWHLHDRVTDEPGRPVRPWCCPEPRCAPVHMLLDAEAIPGPSESFVCFGDAPPITFSYDGAEHANDARSCHFTPLKGLIAYQENADDWDALRSAYWRAGLALATHRARYEPPFPTEGWDY